METDAVKTDPFDAAVMRVLRERLDFHMTTTSGLGGRVNITMAMFDRLDALQIPFALHEIQIEVLPPSPQPVVVNSRAVR